MFDRRSVIAGTLFAALAAPGAALAQKRARATELLPIWPERAPGGGGVTVTQRSVLRSPSSLPTDIATYGVTKPMLTIIRPERSNGLTILMVPGGSYERIALASDGGDIAHLLADLGFTVGALLYRLPYDGWSAGPDAPLQDAQRAFRLLRAQAKGPTGVIGFSAGGHLAASLATRFAERTYPKLPDEDGRAARPDFAGLFVPVITMTEPHAHAKSRENLIGRNPDAERIRRWSVEQNVPGDAPPTFIAAAADDNVVPVENSLLMFAALRKAKTAAAMHIFEIGGHGLGSLKDGGGAGYLWPLLFRDWLDRQRLGAALGGN